MGDTAACEHPGHWFDRTVCPEPCAVMHSRCIKCQAAIGGCPFEEPTPAVESRIEYGVRFEDGTVWPRPDREAAVLSARSIQGRHGVGQVVTRTVTATDWTEAGPAGPVPAAG